MIRLSLLLALVACHQPRLDPVVTAPPPGIAVAFERILPVAAQQQQPLFEADGAITIGTTCWRSDGQRLAACAKLDTYTLITDREASPARTAMLETDDDHVVVHWKNEAASFDAVKRACWIDEHHIAWLAHGELIAFDLRQRKPATSGLLAGTIVACDPAGGRAVIANPAGLTIVDLVTLEELGHVALHADRVAFAADKLAVVSDHTLLVLRRAARTYVPELRRTSAQTIAQLAFSRDGSQLAVVGQTFVMFTIGALPQRTPELPVATLAAGFTRGITNDTWHYAQLATPSRWAALPAVLVDAQQDMREVRTLAIEPATVSAKLAADADDVAIRSYALQVMPELFESWEHATLAPGKDAEFTLRVGHRDGKAWFETRELWTDGCEPYDGYTQVVIDRDLLFVTRVLVAPGDTTNPWMQTFFDLPFQTRTQLARRRGPDLGPC